MQPSSTCRASDVLGALAETKLPEKAVATLESTAVVALLT